MAYKLVKSIRLSNYIQENGIQPVREFPDGDLYEKTPQLFLLLDRYQIIKSIGNKPNR